MFLITMRYSPESLWWIRGIYVKETRLWQENTCAKVTQERRVQLPSIPNDHRGERGEECSAEATTVPDEWVKGQLLCISSIHPLPPCPTNTEATSHPPKMINSTARHAHTHTHTGPYTKHTAKRPLWWFFLILFTVYNVHCISQLTTKTTIHSQILAWNK